MAKFFNLGSNRKIKVKPLINIGCLMDIPTGNLVKGRKGETIVNGGLGTFDGIAGPPNNFKSRILRYMLITAGDRISATVPAPIHIYDTEDSLLHNPEGLLKELQKTEWLGEESIESGQFTLVSKSEMLADEWAKELYSMVDDKIKDKSSIVEYSSFTESIKSDKPLKYFIPSFIAIDSLTKLEPSNTVQELEKGNLDNNTLEMRKNLYKSKLVGDLPRLANKAGLYIAVTAHMAKEINIPSGPGMNMPTKSIQYLKAGDKVKGVTLDTLYLTTHFWIAHMSKLLKNKNTGEPEFPNKENDLDTDLHLVQLTLLRSKSGQSGITLEIIVSQTEGVLPDLTQFYYIKQRDFGLEGSPRSYWLTWLPDIKLQRTTVRKKLQEDEKLRRVVEIMSDLLQLYTFKPDLRGVLFDDLLQGRDFKELPKIMLEKMKEKNIDLDTVLNTRNWWTIDNYSDKLKPYLSTVDLLNWLSDKYVPFWYKK